MRIIQTKVVKVIEKEDDKEAEIRIEVELEREKETTIELSS